MNIVGEENTEILLDQDFQPIINMAGELDLVHGMECWLQDIRLEAMTEQAELFYEDDQGKYSYGFGLLDFQQKEYTDFIKIEIQQRVKNKLSKRRYIDERTISTVIYYHDGIYKLHITFKRNDVREEYNLNIEINKVEVIVQ